MRSLWFSRGFRRVMFLPFPLEQIPVVVLHLRHGKDFVRRFDRLPHVPRVVCDRGEAREPQVEVVAESFHAVGHLAHQVEAVAVRRVLGRRLFLGPLQRSPRRPQRRCRIRRRGISEVAQARHGHEPASRGQRRQSRRRQCHRKQLAAAHKVSYRHGLREPVNVLRGQATLPGDGTHGLLRGGVRHKRDLIGASGNGLQGRRKLAHCGLDAGFQPMLDMTGTAEQLLAGGGEVLDDLAVLGRLRWRGLAGLERRAALRRATAAPGGEQTVDAVPVAGVVFLGITGEKVFDIPRFASVEFFPALTTPGRFQNNILRSVLCDVFHDRTLLRTCQSPVILHSQDTTTRVNPCRP